MKRKALLLASVGVLSCAVCVTALAVGGANQLDRLQVKANPTGHSFTFNAATGGQFKNDPAVDQVVNVVTGVSDPIMTIFEARNISSLAFGQNGRFVEAHPIADKLSNYSLSIGINNLTHFAIDVGVENDGGEGYEDLYEIELLDKVYNSAGYWDPRFELDGDGNGTAHIEWDKGDYDGTVVEVFIQFEFEEDSAAANLYIESISLTWEC